MGFDGPTHVRYRRVTADGGHVSLIEIVEGGAGLPCNILSDHLGGVPAHLHSWLSDSWDLAAIFFYVGQIAADEDIGMIGGIQIEIDDGAAAFVGRGAQHFAQGRSLYAGCPQG